MNLRSCALALAGLLASTAVEAADFRFTNAFASSTLVTPHIAEFFAKQLQARGHKVTMTGPETTPSFEQLQPVIGGVFDFGLTTGSYHGGTITAAITVDSMNADLDKMREAGIIDAIDQRYQKIGVKIVAMPFIRGDYFQIILREPVGASGDLKGRKLRAAPNHRRIIQLLGATEVLLSNTETYPALDKGVVDGAFWSSTGILTAKFYEVNKFLVRPTWGRSHSLVLMNLNRWNGLSEADRKTVLEVGRATEQHWAAVYQKLRTDEEATLLEKHGMKITRLGDAFAPQLEQIWKDGAWEQAMRRDKASIEELRKLAKEKGVAD